MFMKNPFNWNLKFGSIPSEFKEAMTYEEQIIWLYSQIKELKEGSANYNYNLLENKPSIDGVVLSGNITKTQLGIEQNYSILMNKPLINNIILEGNKSLNELGIQAKLIAGSGIRISGNTISTTGGGSGGTSNYEELENLPAINGIELIGDKTGEQLNLQNSLSIDYSDKAIIRKYYDMSNIQVGDIIQTPLTFNSQGDRDCIVIPTTKGMKFNIYGKFQYLVTNSAYIVTNVEDYITEPTTTTIEILSSGGMLIINFDNQLYSIKQEITSEYLQLMLEKQEGDFEIRKLTENIPLDPTRPIGSYIETGLYDTSIYSVTIEYENNSFLIAGTGSIFYFDSVNQTFITPFMSVTFDNNDNQWYINQNAQLENELSNNRNKIPTSQAVYQALQNISPSAVKTLTSNIVLEANTQLTLETGIYKTTDNYKVYFHNGTADNLILESFEMFYFDNTSQTLIMENKNYFYDTDDWYVQEHFNITNEVINNRNKIPTSQAVYQAIQNSNFYAEIDSNITLNADGTITPELQEGYYFLKSPRSITYYDNTTPATTYVFTGSIFYYDGEITIKRTGINERMTNQIETLFIYSSRTNSWELKETDDNNFVKNLSSTSSHLQSTIPATGDDNNVANINAVRNYSAQKNNYDIYSTNETRVGTWIDGKPLYRKIFQDIVPSSPSDNTGAQNNIDITSLNVDKCFIEWSSIYDSTYSATYQTPVFRVQTMAVRIVSTSTTLTIWNYNTLYNNNDVIVSFLYTKTTD